MSIRLPTASGFAEISHLAIPFPDEPFLHCTECVSGRHERLGIERASETPPLSAADLAYLRWILGHHVAVCIWRLLADALRETRAPSRDESQPGRAVFLLDAYSAMLVYTGSCTAEVYKTTLRPKMMATSPAFSGAWARDYEPLRKLVKVHSLDRTGPLAQAYRANVAVHISQAKRLVPDGVSLLQSSHGSAAKVTDEERELFDRFFRIHRARCCRWQFGKQLVSRISIVLDDLRRQPLPPEVCAEPESHPALAVEKTLQRLVDIVAEEVQ